MVEKSEKKCSNREEEIKGNSYEREGDGGKEKIVSFKKRKAKCGHSDHLLWASE